MSAIKISYINTAEPGRPTYYGDYEILYTEFGTE